MPFRGSKMRRASLLQITSLLLLIIRVRTIGLPGNRDSYPGQAWPFREAVIRAQCEANCLSRYGVEPSVDPSWLETYDVYVPLTCPETDGPCTQCLNPCLFIFGTKEKCYSNCATRHCIMSCDKIHELLVHEQQFHEVMFSEFNMRLTEPKVTCQSVSFYGGSGDTGGRGGPDVYLRWDVRAQILTQTPLPLAFVLEISAEHDGAFTNWIPFSGTHAWIPVSANWSTSYHFRVTPVLKDGRAGGTRSSKLITTLPKRPDLKPPTSLRVARQQVRQRKLYVTFEWTPSPDVMSCHYELMLLPTGLNNVISSEAASISFVPQPRYQYGPLPYDTEYTARISACAVSHRCTSDTASVTFTTISCLQGNNNSYFLCEPERPVDFNMMEKTEYLVAHNNTWSDCFVSLKLTWSPPLHASHSNPITAYRLSVVKIPDVHQIQPFEPHEQELELPANISSYILHDLHSQSEYVLRLAAMSYGGNGPPDSLYVNTTGSSGGCSPSGSQVSPVKERLNSNQTSPIAAIVAPILCVIAAIAAVVAGIKYRRRLMDRGKGTGHGLMPNRMEGNPFYEPFRRGASVNSKSSTRSSGDIYEVEFADLELDKTLGQGAFGKVVKGRLNALPKVMAGSKKIPPMTVAVKMLKDFATVTDSECLLQEIALMKTLGRHPNVVSLVACVTTSPHLALVMDYCSHGDLKMHLRKIREKYAPLLGCQSGYSRATTFSSTSKKIYNTASSLVTLTDTISPATQPPRQDTAPLGGSSAKSEPYLCAVEPYGYVTTDLEEDVSDDGLSPTQLLSYARQITVGMEYLSQKKFIHRDLAARNILVCEDGLLKISDFGLTRDIYEHNVYHKQTDGKLPIKWMSIEAIFDQVYTTKSDVWSFGIVLWEIATLGGTPYPGISSGDIYRKLKEGYRMEKPDSCSQELYSMMRTCWLTDPDERPDFTDLRSTLEGMMEQDQDNTYLSLELAPDDAAAADNTTISLNGNEPPEADTVNASLPGQDKNIPDDETQTETNQDRAIALSPVSEFPPSDLDQARADSEPLLPAASDSLASRIPISAFPRRKGDRVQNVYTDMKSHSKQSLNQATGTNHKNDRLGGRGLKPIHAEQRSKSSQDLGLVVKSHVLLDDIKAARHHSAEDIDFNELNCSGAQMEMVTRRGQGEGGGGFVKATLSEVTKEFLKYWLPERVDAKQVEAPKENDPLRFARCQGDVFELESRM